MTNRMNDTDDTLQPQADVSRGEPGGEGVLPLYRRLRKLILDGAFPPGAMLSQVKLAESLGVSRIPLREALRMLQNEGLVEAEHNQRARVPAFESAIVDSLYASRILLEALGIRLTVPHIDQTDTQALNQTLADLDEVAGRKDSDLDAWEVRHRRFHALLVRSVDASQRQRIARLADQCEYYRRLYYRLMSQHYPTRPAEAVAAEHRAIANACFQGNADLAASLLARHYARTALSVLGQMVPEFDPVAIRTAMQIVGADTRRSEEPAPRRRTRGGQVAQAHEQNSRRG